MEALRARFSTFNDWVYSQLEKTWFPLVKDVAKERKKLEYLRMFFGFVVLDRTFTNTFGSFYFFEPDEFLVSIGLPVPKIFLYYCLSSLLVFFFMIGFLTPVTGILLALIFTPVDAMAGGRYLGNTITCMGLMMLTLNGVGQDFSVDKWLSNGKGFLSTVIKKIYNILGTPDSKQLTTVYFFAFVSYGFLNIAANLYHLQDPIWQKLYAIQLVLTAPYLGNTPYLMRMLEQYSIEGFHYFFATATVLQIAYEFLIIFLVLFWKHGRKLILSWAAMFLISTTLIMLIAIVEEVTLVVYLGTLLPCRAKYFRTVEYEDGGWRSLIVKIARICDMWSLFNFIPTKSGAASQKFISNNDLFKERKPGVASFISLLYIVLLFNYILTFPIIQKMNFASSLLKPLQVAFGMEIPGVYNSNDLGTPDRWPVMFRKFSDGTTEIMPWHGFEGERLEYYKFDYVFVRHGVQWRRLNGGRNAKSPQELNSPGTKSFELLKNMAVFDFRMNKSKNIIGYKVEIYQTYHTSYRLEPLDVRYTPKRVHEIEFSLQDLGLTKN